MLQSPIEQQGITKTELHTSGALFIQSFQEDRFHVRASASSPALPWGAFKKTSRLRDPLKRRGIKALGWHLSSRPSLTVLEPRLLK